MSWQKPSKEKCPDCGGYMLEKGNKLVCADAKMRICKNNREIEWKPNKNRGIRIINEKKSKNKK